MCKKHFIKKIGTSNRIGSIKQLQFKKQNCLKKFKIYAKNITILELKQEKELQQKEQEVQQTALKEKYELGTLEERSVRSRLAKR